MIKKFILFSIIFIGFSGLIFAEKAGLVTKGPNGESLRWVKTTVPTKVEVAFLTDGEKKGFFILIKNEGTKGLVFFKENLRVIYNFEEKVGKKTDKEIVLELDDSKNLEPTKTIFFTTTRTSYTFVGVPDDVVSGLEKNYFIITFKTHDDKFFAMGIN